MSFSSTAGRNSRQRNRFEVVSSPQTFTSDTPQIPSSFHFWNGDEYVGQFAHFRDKQRIAMDGRGVYTTSDGQTYEGIWEDDFLKRDCKITFPDKSVFSGSLDEMIIQGRGSYRFKENVEIEGEFVNNNLVGSVYLKDPQRRVWKGDVSGDVPFVDFHPLHPFWQSVLHLPSKAPQLFYGEAMEENEDIWKGLHSYKI